MFKQGGESVEGERVRRWRLHSPRGRIDGGLKAGVMSSREISPLFAARIMRVAIR